MSHDENEELELTAIEVRGQLAQLENERALTVTSGLADVETYMAELDEEIELWRRLYVAAAVTEIATLRGELFGPQLG
jgi:hypothetical protein